MDLRRIGSQTPWITARHVNTAAVDYDHAIEADLGLYFMLMKLRTLNTMKSWYDQPNGRWVLAQEQQQLAHIWSHCFGYYLLQLALTPHIHELSNSAHQRYGITLAPIAFAGNDVVADFMHLPLATDSVDAVLVHHWLGLYGNPIQALHEIYRVLMPEGHVIICGLHPAWTWNVYDKLRGELHFPWSLHSARVWQVKKWLTEVGFTTDSVIRHSQGLSLYKNTTLPRDSLCLPRLRQLARWNLPIGSGYIMMAHKRVATLTLLRLEWSMQETLASYRKLPEKSSP